MIHCAAVTRSAPALESTCEAWQEVFDVNCRSAFVAARELTRRLSESETGGDIILLGALDRAQSLPLPPVFAASQGALGAMVMAMAKEFGPLGVRINLLSIGVLTDGLSRDLSGKTLADYETFSALRRRGTPEEVARAICWLALHNTYLNGKSVPINGGI